MSTDTARKLLEAATGPEPPACKCPELTGSGRPTHDNPCVWFDWMFSHAEAEQKLRAFAPDLLRGYIGAVEALEEELDGASISHSRKCTPDLHGKCRRCDDLYVRRQALAEWEKLWGEQT